VSGQLHAPAALSSEKEAPGNHRIGGCVGPRRGGEEKILAAAGNRTPVVQSLSGLV
jgi:hypothetical protein